MGGLRLYGETQLVGRPEGIAYIGSGARGVPVGHYTCSHYTRHIMLLQILMVVPAALALNTNTKVGRFRNPMTLEGPLVS